MAKMTRTATATTAAPEPAKLAASTILGMIEDKHRNCAREYERTKAAIAEALPFGYKGLTSQIEMLPARQAEMVVWGRALKIATPTAEIPSFRERLGHLVQKAHEEIRGVIQWGFLVRSTSPVATACENIEKEATLKAWSTIASQYALYLAAEIVEDIQVTAPDGELPD